MFGKRFSEYVRFEGTLLVILAVVGLVRLALSIVGVPDPAVRWLSMNVVVLAGAIWLGIVVFTRGFGSYRHLLPLELVQMIVFQAVAVLGILLSIAGIENIFAAPEYSPRGQSQWIHAIAHATFGVIVPALVLWGIASLTFLIRKKTSRQRAVA